MSILEIQGLESGYGEVQILWGIDLSLEAGRLTSLVGANGVGKTTMLRSVMGTVKPWSGSIRMEGQEVGHLPAHKKPDLGLVLVPEGRQLFTSMNVVENLEMGATNRRARQNIEANVDKVFRLFPRLKERQEEPLKTTKRQT